MKGEILIPERTSSFKFSKKKFFSFWGFVLFSLGLGFVKSCSVGVALVLNSVGVALVLNSVEVAALVPVQAAAVVVAVAVILAVAEPELRDMAHAALKAVAIALFVVVRLT
jgi:hypothetical protein